MHNPRGKLALRIARLVDRERGPRAGIAFLEWSRVAGKRKGKPHVAGRVEWQREN